MSLDSENSLSVMMSISEEEVTHEEQKRAIFFLDNLAETLRFVGMKISKEILKQIKEKRFQN